ncbi:hypothetical protein PG985_009073 [Apiospora marii]|uniref:Uncharacterized protein n=1 Tax=Apiospora marii TaxID=335849 RepID=A0ABR1RAR4_9PEZI
MFLLHVDGAAERDDDGAFQGLCATDVVGATDFVSPASPKHQSFVTDPARVSNTQHAALESQEGSRLKPSGSSIGNNGECREREVRMESDATTDKREDPSQGAMRLGSSSLANI